MSRLKSSALLVAIVIGVVLMVAVTGVAALVSQRTRTSSHARDGKIAYRAALSGIEDGLLRYKYARSLNKESDLSGKLGSYNISGNSRPPKASYELSFSVSSITVGNSSNLSDPQNSQTAKLDDTIDINLSPLLKSLPDSKKLRQVYVYFSKPYSEGTGGAGEQIDDAFTILNYRLVDIADNKTAETQLIKEETNMDKSRAVFLVDSIDTLCLSSSQCHLRIRAQFGSDIISSDARRASGSTILSGGKYIYYALEGYDASGAKIDSGYDKPGTIVITSVGIAGQARRKIEAKIDASSGAYLGLFDYGVYCGDKCDWGSNGL